MRTVIILQARVGSTRLPGKVLAAIGDRPLVAQCLERLIASGAGTVVLATTMAAADDAVARLGVDVGVPVVRGDEHDVLGRFMTAVTLHPAEIVVRATADNPAVDIDAPARAVRALMDAGADYCCESGLPVGAAVEALTWGALVDAHGSSRAPSDREHVTTSIKADAVRYRAIYPPAPIALRRPDLRLTVDTPADLAFMRSVAASLAAPLSRAPLTSIIAAADRVASLMGAA